MATFNAEEKSFISSLFETKIDEEKIQTTLPEDVFNFLKKNSHLKTIKDRVIYRDPNLYRPYATCTITKFILPEMNIQQILSDLAESLTPDFLIFLDFHFLIMCQASSEEEPSDELCLKFQRGSKSSSVNEILKISNSKDLDLLLESFKNFENSDFLNKAFISHSELYDYRGSGLRPYSLLSILVHVQKIN